MPHPILIPLGFRLLIAGAALAAAAIGSALAVLRVKSDEQRDSPKEEKDKK